MGLLRLLVWLLPRAFRNEYKTELLTTVQDQWCAARPSLGLGARAHFWLRQWISVVGAALVLRRDDVQRVEKVRGGRRREDLMEGAWADVRQATRSMVARPAFTVLAAATLALGVGATTAMFSAVNAVLLRELPYPDAQDIFVLRQGDGRDGSLEDGVSPANLQDIAASSTTLVGVSFAEAHGLRLLEDGRAYSLRAWLVSEGFFEAMGVEPVLGRTFLPEEFEDGRDNVVLLSQATWRARYGSEPGIVGQQLVLDGAAHTVVGVLPQEFGYPSSGDVFGPRPRWPSDGQSRGRAEADAVARLAPGATPPQVQADLKRLATSLRDSHPVANADLRLHAIPIRDHLFGEVRSPLLLLLGAVCLVLLIAAANVAGLQLARGAGRSREYAIRGALGASKARILRLLCAESLLLAGVGTLLGIGLAQVGVTVLGAMGPDHLPRIEELRIDGMVLSVALFSAIGSALIAGVVPALRASKTELNTVIAETTRGSTVSRRRTGLRDRLVVSEIALALMLTVGAGLLIRSLDRLLDEDLGFDPSSRLAVQVWAYDENHRPKLDYFRESLDAIAAVPGVEAVGLTTDLPLADDRSVLTRGATVAFSIEDQAPPAPGEEPFSRLVAIDSGYPQALGLSVTAGRPFSLQDQPTSLPVAMVNDAFVRLHFPDRSPLGQRIRVQWRDGLSREIVGVLANVRRQGFDSDPDPEIYVPLAQEPANGLTFVVKTATGAAILVPAVKEAMWSVDPGQAMWAIRPMTDLLADWLRQRRFNTLLLAAFSGLALTLAAVGVYGLMSFSVEQRTRELGVRRALGGERRDIYGLVLRRGLTLALTGTGLGLLGSVVLTRIIRGLLFDVSPMDPMTYIVVSTFVVGVAMASAWIPARRAARIDPMEALRESR